MKPLILRQGSYTPDDVKNLCQNNKVWRENDIYQSQLNELFEISHPGAKLQPDHDEQRTAFVKDNQAEGDWIYFPWSGELIHSVPEADYTKLRTNRNQNLITADEQAKLLAGQIGITGLSVGAGIASALAYSGLSNRMKLAEFDVLETANLNRLQAGIQQIGQPKIQLAAQQIYEVNPYASLTLFDKGLKADDLPDYLEGLNLVFDEIDDFEMKIRLRLAAKDKKIPVLMLTSLGDSVLVDIERYDLPEQPSIFNGLLGDLPEEILSHPLTEKAKIKYATQIVGTDYIPTRAIQSLFEINHKLVGRPQLGSTVIIDGGLGAYLSRRIILGQPLPSGRSYLSLDQVMAVSSEDAAERRAAVDKLSQILQ